jgi:hypothetical protein
MRWSISILTGLGFILPAIGIGHTFWTVIQKRKAQDRAQALKKEIDAKYERLEEDAKAKGESTSDLREARVEEYRARNIPFPTWGYQQKLVEETFYGNVGERLSVAKKDLVFVFGGALSATVASIWSVWIPSGS